MFFWSLFYESPTRTTFLCHLQFFHSPLSYLSLDDKDVSSRFKRSDMNSVFFHIVNFTVFFLCTNPCTFLISSRKKNVLPRLSASLYICISLLPHFFVGLSTISKSSSQNIFSQLSPNFVCFVFSLNPISQEVYHLLFLFLNI